MVLKIPKSSLLFLVPGLLMLSYVVLLVTESVFAAAPGSPTGFAATQYYLWYYRLLPDAQVLLPFAVLPILASVRRLAWISVFAAEILLNWTYLWTAWVGGQAESISGIVGYFNSAMLPFLGFSSEIDLRSLALLGFAVLVVAVIYRSDKAKAALRSAEALAVSLFPLGLYILLFDYREFYIHVAEEQVWLGLGFFTNADLLVATSFIISVCALYEFRLRVVGR